MGLSALQSLTFDDRISEMPLDEQRILRNLPACVYYGVNTNEAVALRMLGVPRIAATPLVDELKITATEPLNEIRAKLKKSTVDTWSKALGTRGASYHRVWSILEGEA